MASAVNAWPRLRDLWRTGGEPLPPQYILMGKLLVLYVIFSRSPGASHAIAPILPWLEHVPHPDLVRFILKLGIAVASLAVLTLRWFRPACLYIGVSALIIVLWSRLNFSNNQVFVAVLLLLLGLSARENPGFGLRWTVVLLYLGAGLNKLLEPDWRNGQFMLHLFTHRVDAPWFHGVAQLWSAPGLAWLLGWIALGTELFLALAFSMRRLWTLAVGLGLAFHASILLSTAGQISHRFLFLMMVAYLPFFVCEVATPQSGETGQAGPRRWLERWG